MTAVRVRGRVYDEKRGEMVWGWIITPVSGERVAFMRRISGGLVRCEGYVVDEVSDDGRLAYRVAIGGEVVTVDGVDVIDRFTSTATGGGAR